jgi:hypothetical protein
MAKGRELRAWTIAFDAREQLLVVTGHGVMNSPQIRQLTVEVIGAARTHQAERVLVDHRDMYPEVGTVDIYNLPELYRAHDLRRWVRAAIVAPAGSEKLADFAFYETVVQNAGYRIRVFTDYETARQWLRSPPLGRGA